MDKISAKNLINKTFESSFDKERFVYFIKNLLNKFEEKTFIYRGNTIPTAFQDSVKTLERIGKYKKEDKKIDILIVQLKKEHSLERARSQQRNFISWYLKSRGSALKDGALVAFVSPNEEDWRFSFVKMEYKFDKEKKKIKEDWTPARRYSFLVGTNEKSHTAQSSLFPLLENDHTKPTLEDLEKAFSIEKVTEEFYKKYRDLFYRLTEALQNIIQKDQKIREDFKAKKVKPIDFSKKLLGQIVFLYFLQKKGWFGVKKDEKWGFGSKHFLRELFNRRADIYKSKGSKGSKNFFNDILEALFYEALSSEHTEDYYSHFDCRIPFLNGGLFAPIKGYDWIKTDILLPDSLFSNKNKTKEGDIGDGILDIFDRYNFTVKEDEPLEKEVAVDPEMLGKVFENLLEVKDRKSKGTYYTPREIVHYMCQESLINYLTEELKGQVHKEDIEVLVHHGESVIENESHTATKTKETKTYSFKLPQAVRNQAELIDKKLMDIRICDPAVGSGAFPVGMMNEIIKVRSTLSPFIKSPNLNNRSPYHFKRHAIENCLYGVDIDSGAIEIAQLRLWLSLIVDEEEREKVRPLPNLDYKIVCGNSLLSVEQDLFNREEFNQLEKLKPLYFNETSSSKKQEYKKQIDNLISEITKGHKTFDFEVYFSEVFHEKKGFDVVIANPPYVQLQKEGGKLAKLYKSQNYQTFEHTGDIYILFYERGLQALKTNGILGFITSNKWMRANYGKKLRNYFSANTQILGLLDMGANVFDTAMVDTNILLTRNKKNTSLKNFKAISFSSFKVKQHNLNLAQHLKRYGVEMAQPKKDEHWAIINSSEQNLKQKIEKIGTPLREWDIHIYRGITTGYNKAFIIDDKTKKWLIDRDSKSVEVIKPVLRGRDIKCYKLDYTGLYLIFIPWHFPLDKDMNIVGSSKKAEQLFQSKYPAVYNYLFKFRSELTRRNKSETGIRYEWYALQRCANTYYPEFEKEKIVFQEMVQKSSFAYDKNKLYCLDTARIITGKNLKFLLSIFNSKLFFYSIKCFYGGGALGEAGVRMKHTFFQNFPVPKVIEEKQKPLIKLVDKILNISQSSELSFDKQTENYLQSSAKQTQVQEYEKQIDQLVYKLYDLTPAEIKIIEQNTK